MEYHEGSFDSPDINVLVTKGEEDVTIKVLLLKFFCCILLPC